MKKSIEIFVFILMCIGMVGLFNSEKKVVAKETMDEPTYTVLMLDVGGYILTHHPSQSFAYGEYEKIKSAAIKYVDAVKNDGRKENIAVVAYSTVGYEVIGFGNNYDKLISEIEKIEQSHRSNTSSGFDYAEKLLDEIDVAKENKKIIHFTNGINTAGRESYYRTYSMSDCGWYTHPSYFDISYVIDFSDYTYRTVERLKEKYNIYSILFLQKKDDTEQKKQLTNFAKRFAKDIQNAGYIEVDDVDNLIFDFDGWNSPIISAEFRFASNYAKKDIDAVCYYSDSYFEKPATEYNDHLATMSFCLELASCTSEDDYTIWTEDEYNAFGKFYNARRLFSKIGFLDFDVNEFWGEVPTMDSIGVVAANKELPDGSTLIAVAVRGNGYGKEWSSNFTMGESGEHTGFSTARDNVMTFIYNYIDEKNIEGKLKFWVVGYSRGGAVANLTAAELSYPEDIPEELSEKIEWDRVDVYGYTFEAPQGTTWINKLFIQYDNIHNIININDLVTYVAPSKWAFTRFGKDKHLPSSKYVGDDFYDLQKEMEKYLYQFEKAEDMIQFETDEDITIIDVNISQIHTWGLPKLTVSQEKMYKYEAVKDCIDCISGDIIGTRTNYYYQYEEIIREIMCFINENSDEKIAWDEFWTVFAKKLTIEQLLKISSPLIMPNGDTPEIRQLKVINNLTKVIDEVLLEINFAFSLDAIERIYSAVPELLYKLLNGVLEDCAVNDLNKIEGFQAIIFMLSDGVLTQPHYPEFTLAWLMQKDSYYGENDSIEVGRTYRVIHINCPVDVNVYSEDTGKMVASIIKDVPQEIEESYINTVINGDDEKIIILPADTNYKVEIIAIGNGTFNYTIDEYSYDEQGNTRIINYYDIPIISGDVLTSRLPAMNKDELYRENENGSSVLYSLMDNNNVEIVPDSELRGEAALEAVYNVKVLNGNEYGYVYGGGKYSIGSFAEIKAYPMYGGEFIGWYKGSELVSTEEKYRFPVKEDINLSAVFKEIQLYDISFEAGEGGMIENIPMKVPTGVNVLLNAIPSSGYEFLGWVASDNGSFENERASNTTYTVGSENVIIEAYFSKIEEEGKQDSDNIKSEPNDKFAEDMNTENESDNLVDLNTGATTHIYGIYSMITVIIVSVLTLNKRKV